MEINVLIRKLYYNQKTTAHLVTELQVFVVALWVILMMFTGVIYARKLMQWFKNYSVKKYGQWWFYQHCQLYFSYLIFHELYAFT